MLRLLLEFRFSSHLCYLYLSLPILRLLLVLNFVFLSHFCQLCFVTSQLQVVEETGVPDENHRLTLSHRQLFHLPRLGFEPYSYSGERQSAPSGGALDHTAIRAAPMLLLFKAQWHKNFRKPPKPCLVGINWIALTEFSQMSTHMAGFQSFSRFSASFCND